MVTTTKPACLLFPTLISTERQVQRRRYGVKSRNIQVIYSNKLKQAYVTANDNMRNVETALHVFCNELAPTQKRIKQLSQAKDLKIQTIQKARIGVELNNAKAKVTLMYIEKGFTVISNIPRAKNKQIWKQLEAIA